jgi:hypothetical protein
MFIRNSHSEARETETIMAVSQDNASKRSQADIKTCAVSCQPAINLNKGIDQGVVSFGQSVYFRAPPRLGPGLQWEL